MHYSLKRNPLFMLEGIIEALYNERIKVIFIESYIPNYL